MTHKIDEKWRNLCFQLLDARCSLLRPEGFCCSLDDLYGGLGISKLKISFKRFGGISHSFCLFLYFLVQYILSYIHLPRVHSFFLIALRSVEGLHGVPSRDSNSGLPYSRHTTLWAAPHPNFVQKNIKLFSAVNFFNFSSKNPAPGSGLVDIQI